MLSLMCICLPSGWLGATHHHSPLCRPQLASLGVAASAPACAWAAAPQGQLLMGLHVPSRPLAHLHAPRGLVGVLLSTSHPVHQLIACCVMGLLVGPPHRWLCDGPPLAHPHSLCLSTPPCLCDGLPVHAPRLPCGGHPAHTHTGAVCWASGPHTQMTLSGLLLSAPICLQMGPGVVTLSPPCCPCGPPCGLHSG